MQVIQIVISVIIINNVMTQQYIVIRRPYPTPRQHQDTGRDSSADNNRDRGGRHEQEDDGYDVAPSRGSALVSVAESIYISSEGDTGPHVVMDVKGCLHGGRKWENTSTTFFIGNFLKNLNQSEIDSTDMLAWYGQYQQSILLDCDRKEFRHRASRSAKTENVIDNFPDYSGTELVQQLAYPSYRHFRALIRLNETCRDPNVHLVQKTVCLNDVNSNISVLADHLDYGGIATFHRLDVDNLTQACGIHGDDLLVNIHQDFELLGDGFIIPFDIPSLSLKGHYVFHERVVHEGAMLTPFITVHRENLVLLEERRSKILEIFSVFTPDVYFWVFVFMLIYVIFMSICQPRSLPRFLGLHHLCILPRRTIATTIMKLLVFIAIISVKASFTASLLRQLLPSFDKSYSSIDCSKANVSCTPQSMLPYPFHKVHASHFVSLINIDPRVQVESTNTSVMLRNIDTRSSQIQRFTETGLLHKVINSYYIMKYKAIPFATGSPLTSHNVEQLFTAFLYIITASFIIFIMEIIVKIGELLFRAGTYVFKVIEKTTKDFSHICKEQKTDIATVRTVKVVSAAPSRMSMTGLIRPRLSLIPHVGTSASFSPGVPTREENQEKLYNIIRAELFDSQKGGSKNKKRDLRILRSRLMRLDE